jgi:hypothetical protein
MRREDFDALLDRRIGKMQAVLRSKALEYSQADDRLHNFHAAARADGTDPAQALWGMALKHWVSIRDMVKQIGTTGIPPSREMVDEKIGDMVNYLVLLEAVFEEMHPRRRREGE